MWYNKYIINLVSKTQFIKLFTHEVSSLIAGFLLLKTMLKKCCVCKEILSVENCYTSKINKSGLSSLCIKCDNIKSKEYHQVRKIKNSLHWQKVRDSRKYDLKAMAYSLYKGLYYRVHGFDRPSYKGLPYPSLKDFYDYALNSETLKYLMTQWQNNNFEPRYTPTVDRIINAKGYVIDNIQFLSKSDNSKKH
jgi:hypothetical protein